MEVKGRFPASPTLMVSFTFFTSVGKGGGGAGERGRERERGGERNCSLMFPLLFRPLRTGVSFSATFSYGGPIIVIKLPEKLIRQTIRARFLKSRLALIQD